MNPKQTPSHPASGLNAGDILYILFRRKWVILACSMLGFIGAGVAFRLTPIKYQSVAELYISYIEMPHRISVKDTDVAPRIETGSTILASEVSIIKSFDLATNVAATIGPPRILGLNNSATNLEDGDRAASLIKDNLQVEKADFTQIIRLTFSHRDRTVVQPVLDQIIARYKIKSRDTHHPDNTTELTSQANEVRERLKNEEVEMASVKTNGGILDVPTAMASLTARESSIQQDNYLTMSELDGAKAERDTIQDQLNKMIPPDSGPLAATNAGATNPVSAALAAQPTEDERDAYQRARENLAKLLATQAALLVPYTTNNEQVKTNMIEIAAAQARKKELERATPGLLLAAAAAEPRTPGAAPAVDPVLGYKTAFNNLATKISGIQARIARQTNELATIKAQKARLIDVGVNIDDLKRAIVSDEQVLKSLEATIVQSSLDQVTNPDRISNISITETPTPPILEVKKFSKLIGGIAVSGVALGLMLAFVLETLVDHSLRRPQEVVSKLPFPLFVSVPYLNGKSKWGVFNMGDRKSKLLLKAGAETGSLGGAETKALAPASAGPVVPWMENPGLQPYHETLRDRLIAYFEMINLTHKPKLVAVTGCHNGAGVSTVASGLASSLSETGEGNVLLVNMSSGDGEAHHFYKGKLNMGLDDILDKEKEHRETALVQDNLYVVQETSNRDKLPSVMPKRFGHLVTQLKASDYDYIIFDMPPVTQISVTPRLARFMDMVMLVVESEKTDRDAAQRAAALLSESRSHVGVVMNKSRSYMPRQLQHEI